MTSYRRLPHRESDHRREGADVPHKNPEDQTITESCLKLNMHSLKEYDHEECY